MTGGGMETDVLVIGAGAAGLSAAISASPRRVLVLSAAEPATSSSTALAQGGLAAPIGAGDSIGAHVADTLAAGCHSSVESVAARIISQASRAIEFLERLGVVFDRDEAGPRLHLEAGHSAPRVLHVEGDRTGRAVLDALVACVSSCDGIELGTGIQAVALLPCRGGGIAGALAIDRGGNAIVINARETVLATGGVGGLFACTTNQPYAKGDGLAMAMACGARVAGIEFIQFHPTALMSAEDPMPLLTEALRGAGACLKDGRGHRFMPAEHPLADLAPRDVVARSVWVRRQRGDTVWLDARAVFRSARSQEFPSALETCAAHGIDPQVDLIPVTAAAHYHMGGVRVDESGRTSIPGLWACGEVACTGIHGANRLASNSLVEAVVCGRQVGTALSRSRSLRRVPLLEKVPAVGPSEDRWNDWTRVRAIMGQCMGPLREGRELAKGLHALRQLRQAVEPESLVVRQRLDLATAMVAAALAREESRGAHWRRDFPDRDCIRDGISALAAWSERGSRPALSCS